MPKAGGGATATDDGFVPATGGQGNHKADQKQLRQRGPQLRGRADGHLNALRGRRRAVRPTCAIDPRPRAGPARNPAVAGAPPGR